MHHEQLWQFPVKFHIRGYNGFDREDGQKRLDEMYANRSDAINYDAASGII